MATLLQINISANRGSTGKIAESIGILAKEQGWNSYIAYGGYCNMSQSNLIKVGGRLNRYIHYAEQRIRDNEGLCSRTATKKLINHINQIRPDVVHLHNIHDHYLNYHLLFEYLNQTNIKVVWTFHDCWAFTGHCFHFVTAGCEKWKTGCFACPLKNDYPKTLFDNSRRNFEIKKRLFVNNKNLTIVPCSDWMADFVRQSFFKDKRIEVIKNGVDLKVYKPSGENIFGEDFSVLAVSSIWNKEKGLNDIYKLRELLPVNYEIIIVGLSENQLNRIPQGIIGIPKTHNVQELVNLYCNARVLINTTYADTFPTVNLEALACGTPVVTYRTGGSPETVSEETGFVVEQGDINDMAESIKKICNDNTQKYQEACRKRAEHFFDKNRCFERYLKLYNSLL